MPPVVGDTACHSHVPRYLRVFPRVSARDLVCVRIHAEEPSWAWGVNVPFLILFGLARSSAAGPGSSLLHRFIFLQTPFNAHSSSARVTALGVRLNIAIARGRAIYHAILARIALGEVNQRYPYGKYLNQLYGVLLASYFGSDR